MSKFDSILGNELSDADTVNLMELSTLLRSLDKMPSDFMVVFRTLEGQYYHLIQINDQDNLIMFALMKSEGTRNTCSVSSIFVKVRDQVSLSDVMCDHANGRKNHLTLALIADIKKGDNLVVSHWRSITHIILPTIGQVKRDQNLTVTFMLGAPNPIKTVDDHSYVSGLPE